MGHSRAQKRSHHDRIVQVASGRVRESGMDRVGVAGLMHDAGLTHGGFYRHFESREDLLAEAVERALHDGGEAMAAVAAASPDPLGGVIDAYLSTVHRDDLATSCAVTTLAGDVARSSPRIRAAYTRQVLTYLDLLAGLLPPGSTAAQRARAIAGLAMLVGALSMARAVADDELSAELLASAATQLKGLLA